MRLFKKLSILLFTLAFTVAELLSFSINAFAAEPTTIVNLSKGKSYTNIGYLSPSTPDTNGKELTDGNFGSGSNQDAAWNGTYHRTTASGLACDEWPLYTTTIDLGGVKSITKVEARFLRFYNAYAHMPKTIKVYASVDGENWMKISYLNDIPWNIADGIYSFGWHVADHSGNVTTDVTGNANSSVRARYVRFDYESRNGYTLCDEITVMGYDGEKSGAITPYNTRKMENGEIMLAGEQTGNIQDMVLIYQSREWTKEAFKPYLTYVDADGNSVDTLYDTALFLRLSSPDGKYYDREDATLTAKDWTDYLDQTFVGSTSTIYTLNEAAKQASIDLDMPDYKTNLVVMIPYPAKTATSFGAIDGRTLDLSVESDWKYLVDWYLNKVIDYVNNGNYEYIDFKGFYWVNEAPTLKERIIYTNDKIDSLGYKSYWIPFFHSEGYFWNEDLGFSALTLQPNHFFDDEETALGAGGTKIIETVAKLGAVHNFGVEMEFDGRFSTDINAYNRFLDYLNASVKMGFDGPGYFRNWYEAGGAILQIYNTRAPEMRMLYDNIYQMIKGNYVQREYLEAYNENLLLGKSYTHNATNWYADRSNDSACTYLTDGITDGSFYGSEYLGVKDQDVTVEMDFSSDPISFKELHIQAMSDSKAAVSVPKSVKISAKSPVTSEWEVVYNGDYPDSARAVFRTNAGITTTGLKFEFTREGGYLFLKEFLAYAEPTCVKADAALIGNGNILAGKTYTHTVTNWYRGEVRDSGTALTDGVKNGTFYGTDYLNAQQDNVTLEFDLGEKTKLSTITLNSLEDASAAVFPPKSAKIYIKSGEYDDWTLVYNGAVGKKDFVFSTTTAMYASKIKMDITAEGPFLFLKEVEAFSSPTTTTPDGKLGYLNLLKGVIPTSESTVIKNFASGGTTNVAILTDGIIKTDAESYKNNITFSDSSISLVYDKTGMKFKEINIIANNPDDLAVRSIGGLKIEKYTNGAWVTIAENQNIPDSTDGKVYAFTSDTTVTAHKLRITMTKSSTTPCDWNGLSISEIQVFEEAVTENPVGTFKTPEAPVITTDLSSSVTVTEGDDLTLSVVASGNGDLTYQWYKDGTAIANATESSYKVTESGTYYVTVTNTVFDTAMSVNSSECAVTVEALPVIPEYDSLQFSKERIPLGTEFDMTFTMPKTVVASSLGLKVLFDNTAFEITVSKKLLIQIFSPTFPVVTRQEM